MSSRITSASLKRNREPEIAEQPTEGELVQRAREQLEGLVALACDPRPRGRQREVSFKSFEATLASRVAALGRTLIVLFLTAAERRVAGATPSRLRQGGRRLRKVEPKARSLETWFGLVRYWRTYMADEAKADKRGFHPLDLAVGLTRDRLSMRVLSVCVRLATKLSFSQARAVAQWFLPTVPSTEVIEQATLGLGRFTSQWFEQRPAPDGDGDVLVVLVDSKGAPTATERELKKRRGKRRKAKGPKSPRHRGRKRRARWTRTRRKKGDKSKNAKMATVVVMYTLKADGRQLEGPINRWVYGSFAPKRHAFVVARQEANKRGFTRASGKRVQLLIDGDEDLARYGNIYFPEAIHTLDVFHVKEKLWEAGECLYAEGTDALEQWVERQKQRLYSGRVTAIIAELIDRRGKTPKTGPGNKGKRKRLASIIAYLQKRTAMMNYDELIEHDLEISTGQVEGAVKHVVGLRCDHGGMRWIKERAEAVLQLRCIDINGDWEAFVDHVHDTAQRQARDQAHAVRIQQPQANPLPAVNQEAA